MALETYFLVRTTCTATDANKLRAGQTHVYINGKGDELVYADSDDPYVNRNLLFPECLRDYGYRRAGDARRCYSYTHPDAGKYWHAVVEIISVTVDTESDYVEIEAV